jgi:outer membrane protein insertion porin family
VAVKTTFLTVLKNIFCAAVILSSCTTTQNYQKGKPFLFKTSIELKGGHFTSDERNAARQRLNDQLDDSARVVVKDYLFIYHKANPSAEIYDTSYTYRSARNMIGSMFHLGYYQAKDSVVIDTTLHTALVKKGKSLLHLTFDKQQRVSVKYIINAGNPTLIDTFSYRLNKPELQLLADSTMSKSFIKKGNPVSRGEILAETGRLVDLYRNNGYYKFMNARRYHHFVFNYHIG